MTVAELAEVLRLMPQDIEVRYLYDGATRGVIDRTWIDRSGTLAVLASKGEVVLYDSDLPGWVTPQGPDTYWEVK